MDLGPRVKCIGFRGFGFKCSSTALLPCKGCCMFSGNHPCRLQTACKNAEEGFSMRVHVKLFDLMQTSSWRKVRSMLDETINLRPS